MLSVAVHKDLGEYKPKLIGKLTTRTLVSCTCALGAGLATGLYIYFILGLNPADFEIFILGVTLPFWLCGFYRPKGLPFEKFLPLWIKYSFTDTKIFYKSTPDLLEKSASRDKESKNNDKTYEKFRKLSAREAYSPKAGKVIV